MNENFHNWIRLKYVTLKKFIRRFALHQAHMTQKLKTQVYGSYPYLYGS